MFIWTSSFKNQSLVFDIYLTNSKDFWTPIRCQMFALNTFLRVSKSAKLSAKHSPNWPGLGLTSDGAKLSGGVKYYYNICFCFYKAAKLYKASTLFLFFVSYSAEKWEVATKEMFLQNYPAHRAEADHLPLTGGNQIFASSSFPETSGHDERIPCHLVLADRFDNMNPFEKV